MTARVLVVDDILSNVKLLEAKLTAEYFEVVSAFNGLECLAFPLIPAIALETAAAASGDPTENERRRDRFPGTADHVRSFRAP